MKTMFKKKDQDGLHDEKNPAAGPDVGNSKLTNLLQLKESVIAEVSEAEENNATQLKLGRLLLSENKSENQDNKSSQPADQP